MKYVKMLPLLAMAAVALMALAGTASATEVTSSTGSTPAIHAASVGHVTLHNAVGTLSCNSTLSGTLSTHGASVTVGGALKTLSFTNCTSGTVHSDPEGHVQTPGSLEFHPVSTTGDATVTWSGAKFSVTMFGVECGYTTSATDIGEIAGGEHAGLKIKGSLPRTFGSILCGSSGNWTGEYKFTHPTDLTVHSTSGTPTAVTSSTVSTPSYHAASVGHTTWHNAVGTISCNSTVAGAVESHGAGITTKGNIAKLSFTNCTNGTVHQSAEGFVVQPGYLEFHAASTTGNATVTWSGAKFSTTLFGVECGYSTSATDIGEIVGGEHAVLKIKATLSRTFGHIFCGATANWTGEYKFSHPTDLTFH